MLRDWDSGFAYKISDCQCHILRFPFPVTFMDLESEILWDLQTVPLSAHEIREKEPRPSFILGVTTKKRLISQGQKSKKSQEN